MYCEASTPESSMCEDFTGGNSCGKVKQFKLPQAVQGPLRRRWTFSHTFFKPCATCILPKNWPFFRSRTNDHTAPCLTVEMLCLGYVLMIIIVTNLAWEPVSQDLYPWLHSNSISTPEMLPRKCSPRLILCQSYLRMCALGKCLVELLQSWSILFIYFQQLVENYIRPVWISEVGTLLPSSDIYVRSFLCPVTLNKNFHTKLWVTETCLLSWD